jgi:hypothetical protein
VIFVRNPQDFHDNDTVEYNGEKRIIADVDLGHGSHAFPESGALWLYPNEKQA